ncbi:hypothetical protein [Pseudomonas typographi]|uniref:hypothetical protein n=1 Tax=Pseudomonas typographi TaxID=2715964 RepID=UPI0016898189|nr:hypothetical protein [Pseudomonas typographi]MBD1554260.1 hypothetical protein [Pseudomonas typographi]
MDKIAQLRHYHSAYNTALLLYRVFEEAEVSDLIVLYERLEKQLKVLTDPLSEEWPRKERLFRHMFQMRNNLFKHGLKSNSVDDARDIVFFDMPALADYLLADG